LSFYINKQVRIVTVYWKALQVVQFSKYECSYKFRSLDNRTVRFSIRSQRHWHSSYEKSRT